MYIIAGMDFGLLVLVGLVAGVFAGLFGIGGGIVIVPALILIAGFPLVMATGTSLAAILLPVGILGVIAYYRARIIDVRASAYIASGLLISVAFGVWLANSLPAGLMQKFYALFCLYVSWTFIEPVKRIKEIRSGTVDAETDPPANPRPSAPALVGTGLLAGIMAGMFGIGGGNIIVPVLALFFHFPAKRAIATSLGALLLPIGLPGVIYYYQAGTLDLAAAAWIALGIFLGTVFGVLINIKLPSRSVKILYGLFLVFVAVRFFFY